MKIKNKAVTTCAILLILTHSITLPTENPKSLKELTLSWLTPDGIKTIVYSAVAITGLWGFLNLISRNETTQQTMRSVQSDLTTTNEELTRQGDRVVRVELTLEHQQEEIARINQSVLNMNDELRSLINKNTRAIHKLEDTTNDLKQRVQILEQRTNTQLLS